MYKIFAASKDTSREKKNMRHKVPFLWTQRYQQTFILWIIIFKSLFDENIKQH